MASSYMTFTPSEAGTSHRTGTISAWLKRADVSSSQRFWGVRYAASHTCEVTMNEYIQIYANYASSEQINLRTTAKYADPGAWYHVVVGFDTTQSVEADRVKLYVNGVQNSTFSTYTNYPALNDDLLIGHGYPTSVGAMGAEGSNMWNGCISWAQYVDGLQLAPTEFGEFDSTSGIWKIKPDVYGTPGINGFCLKMEDRTNLDLDSSSNAHTFTTVGTPTATYDNPSNNFATLNPINIPMSADPVFSKGNNTVVTQDGSGKYFGGTSTLGMEAGKWYCEFKADSLATDGMVGINGDSGSQARTNGQMSYSTSGFGYMNDGQKSTNLTDTSYANSWTTANVIGCAVDLDNLKIYFAKDNVWQDSGDPTSGATGTGAAFTILAASATPEGSYVFGCGDKSTGSSTLSVNFGNGYFGTTAVTSAEADGNGVGAFEYAPPTGYYALCTKNISTQGG